MKSITNNLLLITNCFVLIFTMLILLSCSSEETPLETGNKNVNTIGYLSAQTGAASHFGLPSYYAYKLAIEDLKKYYGEKLNIEFYDIDTESNSDNCLSAIQNFNSKNIKVVLGPMTSSELSSIRNYTIENGMVAISPSSVAKSLSLTDDYIFRMASDDSYQTTAMLKLLSADNIKNIIIVYRDDVWGDDLAESVISNFPNDGGTVFESIKFDPADTDFLSLITELTTKTKQMISQFSSVECGIYLLSFNEASGILEKASEGDDALDSINWYGSSAVSQSTPFLSNTKASEFASQVGFLCPIFGIDDNAEDNYSAINDYSQAQSGLSANIYAYNTYDALWIAVNTFMISDVNDIENFAADLRTSASIFYGASGRILFNEAGDRIPLTFDFYAIEYSGGAYKWVRKAVFNFSTEDLIRY